MVKTTHIRPGETPLEDFPAPPGISQNRAADTTLRLARYFGTTPELPQKLTAA
jgi:plasmid maintenance system antidote protein VapI